MSLAQRPAASSPTNHAAFLGLDLCQGALQRDNVFYMLDFYMMVGLRRQVEDEPVPRGIGFEARDSGA
jgi:hypothetical protein